MYYAKARMYDTADKHGSSKGNKLGDKRFTAVDPVKGNVRNPQSLVQYTFAPLAAAVGIAGSIVAIAFAVISFAIAARGNNTKKVYYKNKKQTVMGSYVFDESNRMVIGTNDAGAIRFSSASLL